MRGYKILRRSKGLLYLDYGDEEGLAQKIDMLIQDSFLWHKTSNEARIVAKQFVWSKIIEEYEKHYLSLEKS